ncbi:MAG: hypothetical protein K8U57_19170 [Planctomycetes bacterium]|nr:hypothetical protein [Planctomycetota bacterium]
MIASKTQTAATTSSETVGMDAEHERAERCENCRFWESGSKQCRRHAPVVLSLELGGWPQTQSTGWCGEWCGRRDVPPPTTPKTSAYDNLAAVIFLERLDPTLDIPNPTEVLAVLLNQLRPDIRRVVIRVHGLDGQPLEGLKGVARELKMDRTRVQALLTAGEQRLAKVIQTFAASHHKKI